jgi:hypothetical protein
MNIPSVDSLALLTADELEEKLKVAQAEHNTALREQASLYDKFEAEIALLKSRPRLLSAEIIVRDPEGRKVDRFETPAPVETSGLAAALSKLSHQVMTGDVVGRATKGVSEAQRGRAEARTAIQREQENHVRVWRRLSSALDQRREREKQASGRATSVAKSAGQNRTPRNMMERLGFDAAGAGEAK